MQEPETQAIPAPAHLAAIIGGSDDAILTKDRNAIIRSWNPGAQRIYGWTAEQAVGRPVSILIPDNRVGEEYDILDRILAGRRVDHYETERVRRDGRRIWVSLTISPVRDDTGEVIAASVIARDVTERREIEQERTRLLAEAREARDAAERSRGRLALVARASEMLTSTLDPGPALQALADLLVERFAGRAAIAVTEGAGMTVVAEAEHDGTGDGGRTGWAPGALLERVVRSRRREHRGAEIAAPIVGGGHGLGAVAVQSPQGAVYAEDDVALLEEIARRAGLAVENARAYRAEHEVAVTLQRTLLPRALREVPGFDFSVRYLPAARALNVGGDWYDLIPAPGGSLVGAIGDVAGRGAEAASIMGQLRNAVRAYAFEGRSPAECLTRVNVLMRSFSEPSMATVALVRLPFGDEQSDLVRAGHLPPLLRSAGGVVERLEGRACVPLGATSHPTYHETQHTVAAGSTLVLYTDGLVERRGEPIDEGLARLEGALAEGPEDLEALADFLLTRLLGVDAEPSDDVALLVLRRLPVDRTSFSFRHAAEPDALAALRRQLRQWLADVDEPQARHDAISACSEAAANVIEHAYPLGNGDLEVEGRRDPPGSVELVVRDHGRWRPERATGGGRGLGLIRVLMDAVEIERGEDGTTVRMRRSLTSAEVTGR